MTKQTGLDCLLGKNHGYSLGLMEELSTKETGKMISLMEKAYTGSEMVISTLDCMMMVTIMAQVGS